MGVALYSIDKSTGKWVYYPFTPRIANGSPSFHVMTVDAKGGTVNLIGFSYVLQHYIDDGRPPQIGAVDAPPPPLPVVVAPNPGVVLSPATIAKLEKVSQSGILNNPGPNVKMKANTAQGNLIAIEIIRGNPPQIVFPNQAAMPLQQYLLLAKQLQ